MAFAASGSYLGRILSRHTVVARVASSSRAAVCSAYAHPSLIPATCRNATSSATLNKKGPATAKSTRKVTKPPPPPKKAASRTPPKKTTSPEMETALHAAETVPPIDHLAEKPSTKGTKKYDELSEEERVKEFERMLALSDMMPMVDPWGQDILDTLDVMIPYPVSYTTLSKDNYARIKANMSNKLKNFTALSTLTNLNAVPLVDLGSGSSLRAKLRETIKALDTQSTKPDSLLASFRQAALEFYQELNTAVATRNDKMIRKCTTFDYQNQCLELVKASRTKNPKGRYIWQLHRTVDPTQVVSLRVTEGYLEAKEPRFGNRLLIHALVKFDTEQSLEIYSDRGVALHTPAPEPNYMVDSAEKLENWRVPAVRRRVTEYLVLEKRGWVLGPWVFREQIWPTP
ncbi:unnamed protein product [Cyclocybe aegerita]|uniref:Uncharacterized protein n=1 Tax=Cyclocybe aegerita TaxID=1973307 RepID=A0A8S0VRP7_CYCAE|nr:unnamed protein product [Cyclocybe aegerita]